MATTVPHGVVAPQQTCDEPGQYGIMGAANVSLRHLPWSPRRSEIRLASRRTTGSTVEPYNYAHFPQDLEAETFRAFRDAIRVGTPAPDGNLTELSTGATVALSSYWDRGPLVIEFGSFS